jgi:prepilin-type N-terminal cleavage/methylation domain-containing protein
LAKAGHPSPVTRNAFTLVEVLVVMALLALIVLSLMTVLNSTQTAFRSGITQAGILESGRAVTDLIKSDLEGMTPSDSAAVNFYSTVINYVSPPSPLIQPLVGSSSGQARTNVLEKFFILSSANVNGSPSWIGTGYVVSTNLPDGTLYPLYRFSMTTNAMNGAAGQSGLSNAFVSISLTNSSVWSHLMDGVVELRVRAFDTNGVWMTTNVVVINGTATNWLVQAYPTYPFAWGEPSAFYMFSNALPASVEVELGVLEDRTLQRAESLSGSYQAQSNYLAGHVGQVHIFRQHVWIRNVDPSAYHQ